MVPRATLAPFVGCSRPLAGLAGTVHNDEVDRHLSAHLLPVDMVVLLLEHWVQAVIPTLSL